MWEGEEIPAIEPFRPNRPRRARSNTDKLIAAKLGQDDDDESDSFRERLWAAWSDVALKIGEDVLGSGDIREVFQTFGLADQLSDDALSLLVDMLDKDGDGKISFHELMDGLKFWLAGTATPVHMEGGGAEQHTEEGGDDVDIHEPVTHGEEKFGDLSKEQVEQLRGLFKGFDWESKGYLNRVQINSLMASLRQEWSKQSPAHAEIIVNLQSQLLSAASATSDGDLHLSPDDFLNAMALISEALRYQTPERPKEQVFEASTTPTSTPPVARREYSSEEDQARVRIIQQQHQMEVQELKQAHQNMKAQNEQYQRRLHEATQLSKNAHKEMMKYKEQLEKAQKQIKNLQGQKEKVAYYSEMVENHKATLLEKDKTEQELVKINTKLVAENEETTAQHMKTQDKLKQLQDEYNELQDKFKQATQSYKQKTSEQEFLLTEFMEKQANANEELQQLRAMVSFLKEQKNKLELQVSQEQMQLSTAHAEIISLRNNNAKLIRKQKKKTLNSFLKARQEGTSANIEEAEEKEETTTEGGDGIFSNSLLSELEQAELENIGKKENEEVTDLKQLIEEREAKLLGLEKLLREKEGELEAKEQKWREELKEAKGELKAVREELSEGGDKLNALKEKLDELARANAGLKATEAELRERLALKDQELRTTLRSALERLSSSQEGELNALKAERDELERELERKERECKKLEKDKAKELKMLRMEFELDRTLEEKRKKGEIVVARGGIGSGNNGRSGGISNETRITTGWWDFLLSPFTACVKQPEFIDDLDLPGSADEFEMSPPQRYKALKQVKESKDF